MFFSFEHMQGVAEMLSNCHCSKEKGTVTKAKSLFVGDLEIFPKISLHSEKPRQFILISIKAFKKYAAWFLKCC